MLKTTIIEFFSKDSTLESKSTYNHLDTIKSVDSNFNSNNDFAKWINSYFNPNFGEKEDFYKVNVKRTDTMSSKPSYRRNAGILILLLKFMQGSSEEILINNKLRLPSGFGKIRIVNFDEASETSKSITHSKNNMLNLNIR